MVQAFRRSTIALWFGLTLVVFSAPLRAADPAPVGIVRSGGTVYLSNSPAQGEATLYSGEVLRTEDSQATVSLVRGDLLVLDRKTETGFQLASQGFLVSLEKGQLSFTSSTPKTVTVKVEELALTRHGSFPSLAQVAMRGDGSVLVAVLRGSISVRNLRPDPVLVNAGQYLAVNPRLAQGQTVGTSAHGKMSTGDKLRTFHIGRLSHDASVALLAAAGAGVVAAVVVPQTIEGTHVSPSAPK